MFSLILILSTILTEAQTLKYVKEAGFKGQLANTMVCIARHESALNPKAVNHNKDGSKDYGLFQINGRFWGKVCDIDKLFDPAYNAQCAMIVYKQQGLTAWVAYKKHKAKCDSYKPKAVTNMCPSTRIINKTNRKWEKRDTEVLKSAKRRCGQKYPNNPCLVEFRRYDNYHYEAICGGEKNKWDM
jgi:hypothetical protein